MMASDKVIYSELLEKISGAIPNREETPDNLQNTEKFLLDLARKWPSSITRIELNILDALIKKIHINKRVLNFYDENWRKTNNAATLPLCSWPLLIMVLLANSVSLDTNEELMRGMALKLINSSFQALDIYEELGGKLFHNELTGLVNGRLKEIL